MNEATSASLAQRLLDREYKNVYALEGGWYAWEEAGYPVQEKQEAESETTE